MNRLEGGMQLEQVRVCTKIGIECMELDPKKRPAARHIIDRLDKITSVDETGISSQSIELDVSLLKEQQYQDRTGNTFAADIADSAQRLQTLGDDESQEKEDQWPVWRLQYQQDPSNQSIELDVSLLKEQQYQDRTGNTFAADIADSAQLLQTLGDDESQEKEDQWPVWRLQYQQDPSVSSSNSGVFRKLSNLDIFNRKSRRNFMRNGGPIIQRSNRVQIFRKEELKPILDSNNLVGRGGFGDVYQGILGNRLVAIRKPIAGSLLRDRQFANEVINRSEVIHRNTLTLIGCCLEVDVPMLIYEFFSNGSLRDILRGNIEMPLDSGVLLRIAAQAADGLAYTHSETNRKILIWGLDAANILLDDNFVPKISEFAILEPGAQRQSNERDPFRGFTSSQTRSAPYYRWGQSDVYSFGLIILELISRKKAIHYDSLVEKFLKRHEKGKQATELYDKEIAITRDLEILDNLEKIGVDCVQRNGRERPSMAEVARRLLRLSRTYTG